MSPDDTLCIWSILKWCPAGLPGLWTVLWRDPEETASYTEDLTLQEAIETAISTMEAPEKDSNALHRGKDSSVNHRFLDHRHNQAGGSPNHVIDTGRLTITLLNVALFIGVTYRICKKTSHIVAVCNSGKRHKSFPNRSLTQSRPSQNGNHLHQELIMLRQKRSVMP